MISNIIFIEDIAIILKVICNYFMPFFFKISSNNAGSSKKVRKSIVLILYNFGDRLFQEF